MKPKFFLPLISLSLLILSLLYAISYQSQRPTMPLSLIPTGIQYPDLAATQATFQRKWISADSLVLWVRGYHASEDMRLEYKNGLLLKRNYLQPGTMNSLLRYETFEYSMWGNLKKVKHFSYHQDRTQLIQNSTRYFQTDWSGNIRGSYLRYVGKPNKMQKREYCWKNGNVAKMKNYDSKDRVASIRRIKYDQHINPMYGLNLFPDDPLRQSLNNPLEISSETFFRRKNRKTKREYHYLYHELGTTLGQLNPVNEKVRFYYLYE